MHKVYNKCLWDVLLTLNPANQWKRTVLGRNAGNTAVFAWSTITNHIWRDKAIHTSRQQKTNCIKVTIVFPA